MVQNFSFHRTQSKITEIILSLSVSYFDKDVEVKLLLPLILVLLEVLEVLLLLRFVGLMLCFCKISYIFNGLDFTVKFFFISLNVVDCFMSLYPLDNSLTDE